MKNIIRTSFILTAILLNAEVGAQTIGYELRSETFSNNEDQITVRQILVPYKQLPENFQKILNPQSDEVGPDKAPSKMSDLFVLMNVTSTSRNPLPVPNGQFIIIQDSTKKVLAAGDFHNGRLNGDVGFVRGSYFSFIRTFDEGVLKGHKKFSDDVKTDVIFDSEKYVLPAVYFIEQGGMGSESKSNEQALSEFRNLMKAHRDSFDDQATFVPGKKYLKFDEKQILTNFRRGLQRQAKETKEAQDYLDIYEKQTEPKNTASKIIDDWSSLSQVSKFAYDPEWVLQKGSAKLHVQNGLLIYMGESEGIKELLEPK